MTKSKKRITLALSSAFLLASCTSDGPASAETSINSDASSIQEALQKLALLQDYDIETKATYADGEKLSFTNYYNPNYIYCDYPSFETGYGQNEKGVFRFDLYKEEYRASEKLDESSLWGSSLVKSLTLDPNLFSKVSDKYVSVTNKRARLQWLDFLDFSAEALVSISEATIELTKDSVDGLLFTLVIEDNTFISRVRHVGYGGDDNVLEFVKGASPAKIDASLKAVEADFKLNNYIRIVEDEYTVSSSKQRVGSEYYLPNYFYQYYYPSSEYAIASAGYISLHNKKIDTGDGDPVEFDGAYMFTLTSDLTEIQTFLATGPAFVTNIYDMPSIMNYPSLMLMFDHNLQFFDLDDSLSYDGVSFSTEYLPILYNFYEFSQIGQVLPADYTTRKPLKLSVTYDEGNLDGAEDDKITFLFRFKNDGVYYDCEFKYEQFGCAEIPAVEEFAALFEDDIK